MDGVVPVDSMLQILAVAAERGIAGLSSEQFVKGAKQLSRSDLVVLGMLMDGSSPEAIAEAVTLSVAEVLAKEAELRKSAVISPDVWTRVARRRSAKYQRRTARKK